MSFEPVKRDDIGLVPVATLVICLACIVIGVMGYLYPHEPPKPPTSQPVPVESTLVNVSLTDEQPPRLQQRSDQPQMQQALAVPAAPSVPALPAVAAPSPAIAFALPVNAPPRAAQNRAAVQRAVATQVFVSGADGNQPKPEYPVECQTAGQEGTVRIDFLVTSEGRITDARITQPCEWPLLNQSALRCVREQWSFSPTMQGPHFVLIDFKQQ
jgi:TonB family protein